MVMFIVSSVQRTRMANATTCTDGMYLPRWKAPARSAGPDRLISGTLTSAHRAGCKSHNLPYTVQSRGQSASAFSVSVPPQKQPNRSRVVTLNDIQQPALKLLL
uniref:Uncharacterized protein n=1 Tax=Anopheles coluzzii TaxID=1518534 RepID=A0A8W7PGN2_ANOCL